MKTLIRVGITAVAATGAAIAGKMIYRISKAPKLPKGFTYTAHTGCEGTEDNSMASIKKSVELNVPVAEVDVTFRDDSTPVLLHGETAGADGGILLEQALNYVHDNSATMLMNLDLKAFHNTVAVVDVIKKCGMQERCFFTGVGPEHTQAVKIDCGTIPYYINMSPQLIKINNPDYVESLVNEAQRSGAIGINCNYKYACDTLVNGFHKAGLKVSFWTANNKLTMKYLISLSPDNITTRYPSVISQLV